jgi:3-phosphoshikimate 1-carboxyvinyltransferase
MNLIVSPSGPLIGECALPGDKSLSHRVALFAALAEGESRVQNFLRAGVTKAMLEALRNLGVEWRLEGETLIIQGKGPSGLRSPSAVLHCGNSGTTLRLLAGALAGANVSCILDGSPGLRLRPMRRIVKPLREMGVPIQAAPGDLAPLTIGVRAKGEPLRALELELPVASAQVKTTILLAGLGANGLTDLKEPGPSRDHTERLLANMGVEILCDPQIHRVRMKPPDRPLTPLNLTLPGDVSSGAFLIVAALILPGSDLLLKGIGLNPTRVGLLDALREMGAKIEIQRLREVHGEPIGNLRVQASQLSGIHVAGSLVVRMIDEFPIFAVAAATAQGQTVISDAEELRYKESDRISSLCQELGKIGVKIEEHRDGFVIEGGDRAHGGVRVSSHGDHRLAMALTVAGLAAEKPILVEGAEIIHESFPELPSILSGFGVEVASQ